MPWPPLYEAADLKRDLASQGVAQGFEAYRRQAHTDLPVRMLSLPLRSARDHARRSARTYHEIDPAGERFVVDPPRTIGESTAKSFFGTARTFFLAEYRDVTVMARSFVLRTEGVALVDYQDDEPMRCNDRLEIDPAVFSVADGIAHIVEPSEGNAVFFDEAYAGLLGPHAGTFGDWIWFHIPRLIAAIESGVLPEMPVLVDRGMPPSHFELLALAIGDRRMPIVRLGQGTVAHASRCWYTSTPFYLPFLPVADERWTWQHIAAPPCRWLPIFEAMRRSVRSLAPAGVERVYFKRQTQPRRVLVNAAEIEAVATERGFAIISPELLTLAEQIAIVRGAKYVAGPEGSTVYLQMFANPGSRLAILDHPIIEKLMTYTAAFEASGVDITVLTGRVVSANDTPGYPNYGHRDFADYEIDPIAFGEFLDSWCAR